MTEKDINILDKLLERLENLPDILYLRAAEIGYKFTEEDKELILDTYEKLDNILKEVAAFINVKFPERQGFIQHWNKIDFDTKIGEIKITTSDREHIKREWRNGLFDLKSLLKSLRNEVILMIDENSEKINESKNINSKIFSGNIIYNESPNHGNQSLSDNARESPIIQKIKKNKSDTKVNRSWIEIAAWISAIVGTIIAIITLLIY